MEDRAGHRRLPRVSRFSLSAAALLFTLSAAVYGADAAPDLRLATVSGASFSLESLKGQFVVLDFWASWCVPCRSSVPFFDSLQDRYQSCGVRVLGLTLEDNEEAVQKFLADVPARYTILRDPTGRAGEAFDVVAMPTTFLLDRDGRIVARFEGGDRSVHTKIEAALSKLLEGGPSKPVDVRVSRSLEATGRIKAWQRQYLADPMMNLDGDPITRLLREHIHSSKEGAAGDGGPAGGGCGCN